MLLLRAASWFFFTQAALPVRAMLPYDYHILLPDDLFFYADRGTFGRKQEAQP